MQAEDKLHNGIILHFPCTYFKHAQSEFSLSAIFHEFQIPLSDVYIIQHMYLLINYIFLRTVILYGKLH